MKTTRAGVIMAVLLLSATFAYAQGTQLLVSNVQAQQRPFTAIWDITYDLETVGDIAVTVSLFLSMDSGVTYPNLCATVTGDVGDSVLPGSGKHIVWDAGADLPRFSNATCRLRVTADDGQVEIPAACFDFDDGAGQQGWYLHHVLGYPSGRVYKDLPDSTNFQSSWSDVVNYPGSYNADPAGNGQGSFWLDTIVEGNPIIRYPVVGDTWWMAHVRSPDLDAFPAWQEAIGFTTQALDHLSWAGLDRCYFSLHFTIWDEDQLRERTWPDVFGTPLSIDQWRSFTIDFNDYALPPNWHLRRVFVQIWGTRENLYQGGLYLDEICPIVGGGSPSQ
jgi:hypothetical protein